VSVDVNKSWLLKNPFSRDFGNEIRSQIIESSFAVGAEIHRNYCFASFFNSHNDFAYNSSMSVIGMIC
jgi:hypothetical protein